MLTSHVTMEHLSRLRNTSVDTLQFTKLETFPHSTCFSANVPFLFQDPMLHLVVIQAALVCDSFSALPWFA